MGRQPDSPEMDRREFLKAVTMAGISAVALPHTLLSAQPNASSRVIVLDDVAATSGSAINASVVQSMVAAGVRSLGQASTVGEAWKALLPGVSAASRIGIKVNCINSSLSSHPAVANAIAASLTQMMFTGTPFPANNIIIFDRTTWELQGAGYVINTSSSGVRCFATDASGVGYSPQTYAVSTSTQTISRIVTERIDFLVNLAVLKNHSGAGVTLCLKNHYGTCNNPGNLHGNLCDPFAAALSNVAPIKAKQKVNIIDALFGIRSGGPGGGPQFAPKTIIMSADIVAADYTGRKLLADSGCTTTGDATHIDTAATVYGLGTNNPALMDLVTIHNPSATGIDPLPVPSEIRLHQNYPNPFNPSTQIRFDLDRRSDVRLRIVNVEGRVVATLVEGTVAAGEHTLSFTGSGLASGTYVAILETGGRLFTQKMLLVR